MSNFKKGKVIGLGEIMLRLSPPNYQRFRQAKSLDVNYGGAEANVIMSLASWGENTSFFTALPENDLGYAVRDQLRSIGVDTSHLVFSGDRLGIYFLEQGAISRGSKVIYDRENSAMANFSGLKTDWSKVFEGVRWLHFTGITPAISHAAAETLKDAVQAAYNMGITLSVDLNYRPSLWQYGSSPDTVMPDIVRYCHVIMADLYSAKVMLDIHHPLSHETEEERLSGYMAFLKDLCESFNTCQIAVSTHRDSLSAHHNKYGGYMYHSEAGFFISDVHNLDHIIDRIGGGDAFSAGVIYGLMNFGADYQKTINFASAAAALKHSIPGDYNLCSLKEVEAVMNDTSGRVAR